MCHTSKERSKTNRNEVRLMQTVRRSALRTVRTSSWLFRQKSVMGGNDGAPWAASSSADVTFLRTWTSGDGRTETYTTWAGQRWPVGGGTSHNKDQWTLIMDYLWKEVGEGWGGPWRHQWTEGIGAGLGERERGRERDVSHPWEQRSASFSADVLLFDSYSLETSFNLI